MERLDLGHKQTLQQASEMSALPTKADMRLAIQKCLLSARSGHDDGPDSAALVGLLL